jgi:hypothetical protein
MNLIHQQNGAALIGVMMTLLVLTLLGTTAFLNTATELKMSSNYDQSLQALYAAEAGLQELLSTFRQNPSYFLKKKTADEMGFSVDESGRSTSAGMVFWVKELRYDSQEIPEYAEVMIYGKDRLKAALVRLRATITCRQAGDSEDLPSIFKAGVVTAGRFNFSGPLDIVGSLHANQGFSQNPPAVTEPKGLQPSMTQSLDPLRPDYLPPMEVPLITDKDMEKFRTLAGQKGNQILFGQQNLVLSGDQKGQVIFVDGQVTLTGSNLSGLTLVATGSITLNGGTVINQKGYLDNAFIAGGNITVKDFLQMAGVFWANGSICRTGAGKMLGAMVCQGNISQIEGFQFERFSQISNSFWATTTISYSVNLTGWSQI